MLHDFYIAGATMEGHDLSLFYGDISQLTTTSPSQKFLADSIYAQLVRDCVICCVDILLVRISPTGKKQCLLVERASEPVKGVWWLPGGRLLKGETFFDAGTMILCVFVLYYDTVCMVLTRVYSSTTMYYCITLVIVVTHSYSQSETRNRLDASKADSSLGSVEYLFSNVSLGYSHAKGDTDCQSYCIGRTRDAWCRRCVG